MPETEPPEKPDKPEKPKQTVIVPPFFGPCAKLPPAPPYRQYEQLVDVVLPEPTLEQIPEPTPEPNPAAPIRPLCFKSNHLDAVEAESFLERTLDHHDSDQLSAAGIETDDTTNEEAKSSPLMD